MSYINNGKVANCISILKKTILVNKKNCYISFNKLNYQFIKFLYNNGFIDYYNISRTTNKIFVSLKIYQDKYVLHNIVNFYKPGNLIYYNNNKISRLKKNKNIQTLYIFLTEYGFLTLEQLFFRKIGGILICKIN